MKTMLPLMELQRIMKDPNKILVIPNMELNVSEEGLALLDKKEKK